MYDSSYERMERNWRAIIDVGPHPFGSESLKRCSDYIASEMRAVCPETAVEPFRAEAFHVRDWSLSIVSPAPRKLESYLFLGSGRSEGFRGRVRYAGKNRIWDMYAWDRFAVVDDSDEIQAYITVRTGGGAIAQTLAEGNSPLPHFIVGQEERGTFEAAEKSGLVVEGFADTDAEKNAAGYNIVVPVHKAPARVVLCAHYDTVYNTPGAYDNSAGAAVLMEVARRVQGRKFRSGLDIIFMDGEEFRLLGAKHQSAHHSDGVDMVINVDGVGRERLLEVWSGPESFERKLRKYIDQHPEVPDSVYTCPPPPGSDHAPYYERGIPVCMLTFNDQGVIHHPQDVYEPSKLDNMAITVRLVLGLLEHLNIIE